MDVAMRSTAAECVPEEREQQGGGDRSATEPGEHHWRRVGRGVTLNDCTRASGPNRRASMTQTWRSMRYRTAAFPPVVDGRAQERGGRSRQQG